MSMRATCMYGLCDSLSLHYCKCVYIKRKARFNSRFPYKEDKYNHYNLFDEVFIKGGRIRDFLI